MIPIKIYNSDFTTELAELPYAISATRKEQINGVNTLDFRCLVDEDLPYIEENNTVMYGGDKFDIAYYKPEQGSDGRLLISVECEHVSYRLNNEEYNVEFFTEYGTPTYILEKILAGTPFSVDTVEYSSTTTFSLQQATSRRALLMQFVAYLGGELMFDGFKVSILTARGNQTATPLVVGEDVTVISKAVDKRKRDDLGNPTVSYTCRVFEGSDLSLGDKVTLKYDALGIDVTLRIVTLAYDPYNPDNVTIEIGNYINSLEDDLYRIETQAVQKDALYNGIRIGPEYGFEAVRNDKKARAYFRSDEMKFQSGDGSGSWTDRLTYEYDAETGETTMVFNGKLSADAVESLTILVTESFTSRIESIEGDIGTLELTATSLASRIETAEGSISTLQQTATSLTSRISTAEGNISTISQTANKISWLIASGTSESNFTMTSRAIQLVADSIDLDGFVTFTNLSTVGQTTINGGNITAGTISADRIDVANLKVQKLYTSTNQVAITSVGTTTLHIGGDGSWNYSTVNLYAGTTLMLGNYSASAYRVTFSFTSKTITFGDANWDLGSSLYPLHTSYFNQLYANKVGAFSATDFVDEAYITEMRFGGTSLYHIVADARQLYPNSTSASYPFYLGTSTYPWHYAYIGSNTVMIGTTASSKLGFFGTAPIAKQTLSLSSNNMGYTSVTASNYLYALNNIIGILKNKYGLIA